MPKCYWKLRIGKIAAAVVAYVDDPPPAGAQI